MKVESGNFGVLKSAEAGSAAVIRPPLRLPWIDHLRTFIIFLVVIQHACVTYSHVGSWYTLSRNAPALSTKIGFIFWEGHMQTFFMGLLFFLAGYFAHFSLLRRGPKKFFGERFIRLGLPTLFFMLVIHPFILLGLNPFEARFPPLAQFYPQYLSSGQFVSSSGPLWFTFALLIFCAVLAVWRLVRPEPPSADCAAPGPLRLWVFGIILVATSFFVRISQPVGSSFLNFQLGYFPQYIAAFLVGLAAARHRWLLALASSASARRAGWIALAGGPVALFLLLRAALSSDGKSMGLLAGGFHWEAFGLATWEQLTGLGLALGLLAWFSRHCNRDGPVLRWLGDRTFAVYVFHAPVLVGLTMVYRSLEPSVHPAAMAALLAATGIAISFGVGDLARRIPGLRAIL